MFVELQTRRPVRGAQSETRAILIARPPEQERATARAVAAFDQIAGRIPADRAGNGRFVVLDTG
jgi:hypothetical protein